MLLTKHHRMKTSTRMRYVVHVPCVRCEILTKFWPENLKEIAYLGNTSVDYRAMVTSIAEYFYKTES